MKISASFLGIKENISSGLKELCNCDIDYIHLDVMDGVFVENKTYTKEEFEEYVKYVNKPLDIHLMVNDVKKYIDDFSLLKPEYLTFHYEAVSDVYGVINYIKEKNIKVGLSIKPSTNIEEIIDLLPYIDLILVMSVEPGRGGQKFIDSSIDKINDLYNIRKNKKYSYIIEVDGGINNETIKLVDKVDIAVVGSYITNQDYNEAVKLLRK